MPLVDFDTMSGEMEAAKSVRVMQALIRSSLLHGSDNRPAMVVLTDDALFWGGCEATGGKFHRVPLKSVIASSKEGKLIWECVMLRHMDLEGERTLYICPFTGPPGSPKKDMESLGDLLDHLGGR
jgi:hypothetical protein